MEIYNGTLTGRFDEDVAVLDAILRTESSFDMLRKTMEVADAKIVMYYIDGFVKAESLQKLLTYVISVKSMGNNLPGDAQKFADQHMPAAELDVTDSIESLVLAVMSGCTVFLCEKFDANALIIDLRTYPARQTEEPENDKVMRGSRDGFVETMIF
ncbi:MAG: spore germination protein, partial [Clostridia bacterium]|nr:spore germination protein [Clostridia bacterium]